MQRNTGDQLELYGALDAIEAQVPELPKDVRIVNLSFGPEGPIDAVPSRFTYSLDRMTRDYGKIFFTAVGNWGDEPGRERVQSPADSVNNVGVGAFKEVNGSRSRADYSSKGPGRFGGRIKPDLLAFGGCDKNPFTVLDVTPGMACATTGTSFAAPLAASLAGHLDARLSHSQKLSPEAIRALLIQSARETADPVAERGHGLLADSPEVVLECSSKRVSVLYQGDITPRLNWKLPFLLPPDFDGGGNVTFTWTIAFSPAVDHTTPSEYTLAGLDVQFRPHSERYSFNPPKGSDETAQTLDVVTNSAQVRALLAAGWRQSPVPVSDSPKGVSELELRAKTAKWETVVRDRRNKRAASVAAPILTVSILGRGAWDKRDPNLRARFAAVLTVDAPKYEGDLYNSQTW